MLKSTILFISAHFPNPNSTYAGHKIAYDILRKYDQSYNVDLVIVCNAEEWNADALKELNNTRVVFFEGLTSVRKIFNILSSGHIFPLKIWTRFSARAKRFVEDSCQKYDLVHLEFTHAAALFPKIAIGERPPVKNLVVTLHDILIQGKLRSRAGINVLYGYDVAATFKFENNLCKIVDTIQVLCQKDKKLIESLYAVPENKIRVVEPAISSFTTNVFLQRNHLTIQARTILFWGAMNRRENEEAALLFVEKFGRYIAEHGYRLLIVGNAPSPRVRKLATEHVVVTGFVEDPTPYFLEAEVGIVPLLSGAGIKIKTLEMLRSGIPVVSTDVGAEGINDPGLFVVSLDKFMATIESVCERRAG